MSGELRCRPGDLAIVVREEPGCEGNLGRIVEVDGPLAVDPELGLPCWLIRPVSGAPFTFIAGGRLRFEVVEWSSRVELPDAWLLPIRRDDAMSLEEAEACARIQERIDRELVAIGAVQAAG